MKKVTRIVSIFLIGSIVVVAAGAAAILLFVDPNAYKTQITAAVKQQTGRDLTLGGDIKLSLFPWVGVSLGDVTLSNAAGFGPEPMIQLKSADVKVKVMPLLSRRVEIAGVLVDGVQLNLGKDKSGKTNWDDLVKPSEKDTPAAGAPAAPSPTSQPALAGLVVGAIEIRNTSLAWTDAATGAKQHIQGLTLRTGTFEPGKPTDVAISFKVDTNNPPASAAVDAATRVTADMDNERYALDNIRLDVRVDAREPAMNATATLTTSVNADLKQQNVNITDIHLVAAMKQAQMETNADLTAAVTMNLATQQLRLSPVKLHAVNSGPAIPGGKAELTAGTDIDADLKQQTLHVANLIADAFGMKVDGDIRGEKIIDAPQLQGKIALAEFNPRDLLTKLGQTLPAMADAKAMTKAQARLSFAYTPQALRVEELHAQLDQTTLRVKAAVKTPAKTAAKKDASPEIEFDINVDDIDADRYLPPKSTAPTGESKTATTQPAPAADIPLEPLRALNVKGGLDIGKVKVAGFHAAQLHVAIDAKDGLIHVQPLAANLYQGKLNGSLSADARGDKLKVSLDDTLSGVQIGQLLKDFMGDDKFSGVGNVALKADTTGNNVDAMIAALNGNGSMNLRDGAVKGFNLGNLVRKAQAKLRGEPAPASDQVEKTDFSSFDATFAIKDGVAANHDLSVKSPLLRVTGDGSANLPAQEVDYVLTVTIVGTSKGQEGRELDELKGLPIDVKMQGKFADPKFNIDLGAALKAKAKAKVDEKKTEIKQKAEEKTDAAKQKLEEKARDKLKNLFR